MLHRLALLAALLLWPLSAQGQAAYPSRTIRFVVPYAAGGIADLLVRTIQPYLAPALGQTIVIDNQPGAGGHVAASAAAKSAPDGYTLVLTTIAHNAAASMYPSLAYDPQKDLKPVAMIAESAGVLVVSPAVPARSVRDFIDWARSEQKPRSYGSAGHGSAIHLAAELFKAMAKVDLVHVPYRGSAPAMNDLLSGNIDVMFENIPTALQHVRAGSIRALGVTSPARSELLPEVPTIDESGVRGYAAVPWYVISVPVGVPDEIVGTLNAAVNRALQEPQLAQRWKDLGLSRLGGSPPDAEKRSVEETRRWSEVIRSAGIKAQ